MLSNMSIKTFNVKDIDPILLKERAKKECDQIWNNPNSRRGRSYNKLLADCMQGHAAEIHLIKNGYKNNPKKYMDVFDLNDITVDVKAFMNKSPAYSAVAIRNTLAREKDKKLQSINSTNGFEYAEHIYIYLIDPIDGTYALEGIYLWDGKKFKKNVSD